MVGVCILERASPVLVGTADIGVQLRMLVSNNTLADSNFSAIHVFLDLVNAIEFLAFDFDLTKLVHGLLYIFGPQPASIYSFAACFFDDVITF